MFNFLKNIMVGLISIWCSTTAEEKQLYTNSLKQDIQEGCNALIHRLTNDKLWSQERISYIWLATGGAIATVLSTYGSAWWYLERKGVDYTALCPLMIPWALIMLFTDIFTVSDGEDKVQRTKSLKKYLCISIVVLYPILAWFARVIVSIFAIIVSIMVYFDFSFSSAAIARITLNEPQIRALLFEALNKLDKGTLPIVKPRHPSTLLVFPRINGCRVKLSLSHKVQFDEEDLQIAQSALQNGLEEECFLWFASCSSCPIRIVQITQSNHAVMLEIALVTDNQSYQQYVKCCNKPTSTVIEDETIYLWDSEDNSSEGQ